MWPDIHDSGHILCGAYDSGRATRGSGIPFLPATLLVPPSGCAGSTGASPMKVIPVSPPVNPHSMTTQTKWGFQLSADKLTLSATLASCMSSVPNSAHAALTNLNWRCAMEEEFASLIVNNTQDLVPHPVRSTSSLTSGSSTTSSTPMALWNGTGLTGPFVTSPSDLVSTIIRRSTRWSS
jgi:hypothetical protein